METLEEKNGDICVHKVESHLKELDKKRLKPYELKNEQLLKSLGPEQLIYVKDALIKTLCDKGGGKRFCRYMDKVIEKEKELGRELTLKDRMKIDEEIDNELKESDNEKT